MSRTTKRTSQKPAATPVPPRMDQVMSDLRKLLTTQEFGSIEEANAFLQKVLRENQGQIPHVAPETPLEQAMEVIYEAEAETSPQRQVALARQALEISPDCAEAYSLL